MHEFVNSFTDMSSKMQKCKTYDEVISNPIYKNKWREVINKKL